MSTRTSATTMELQEFSSTAHSELDDLSSATTSTSGLQAALEPTDRGKGAYGFLLAAFMLEVFIFGWSYSFATILNHLKTHEPWDQQNFAAISAIGTTQAGLQFLLPLPTMFTFARYPEWVKTILWSSVAISSLGQLLASFVNQKVWQLIMLQGIITGAANGILFTPVFMWLSQWWVARRSTAYGVICSGIGVGGFGFPFLMNSILERGGFAWLCRAWSAVLAVVLSISVYLIRPRLPVTTPETGRRTWLPVDWTALKSPTFLLMGISSFLAGCSYLPVALYLPTYASSLTTSTTQQNLVLAIFSLVSSLGSLLTGVISDRSYTTTVVICGICGTLLSLSAWGLADSLGKVYAFAVLFSLTGQMVTAWGGAARDVAGANANTAMLILCIFCAIRGVASITIPFLTELLYTPQLMGDLSEWGSFGFSNLIVFVGVTAFLSSLGGVAMQMVVRKGTK